jgi:hypothetical protein
MRATKVDSIKPRQPRRWRKRQRQKPQPRRPSPEKKLPPRRQPDEDLHLPEQFPWHLARRRTEAEIAKEIRTGRAGAVGRRCWLGRTGRIRQLSDQTAAGLRFPLYGYRKLSELVKDKTDWFVTEDAKPSVQNHKVLYVRAKQSIGKARRPSGLREYALQAGNPVMRRPPSFRSTVFQIELRRFVPRAIPASLEPRLRGNDEIPEIRSQSPARSLQVMLSVAAKGSQLNRGILVHNFSELPFPGRRASSSASAAFTPSKRFRKSWSAVRTCAISAPFIPACGNDVISGRHFSATPSSASKKRLRCRPPA